MQSGTKKLTTLAMLSALAYLLMFITRALPPVVLFLKYDPKDVVIAIGGFIFGPLSVFVISAVVSLIEMFTVSETGFIGFVMNVLSTCAFCCTAAAIYKRKHTITGAVIGLAVGCITVTAVMLLWNYCLTPIYMGRPRSDVAAMLIPVFLPYNLIKGGLNAAITLLVYKPIRLALIKSGMMPAATDGGADTVKINIGVMLTALLVIISCVMLIFVYQGIL